MNIDCARRASASPLCVTAQLVGSPAPGRRSPSLMFDGARSVVIHGHGLLAIDAAVISGQRATHAIQCCAQRVRAAADALGALGSAASRRRPTGSSGTRTTAPAQTQNT